MEIQLKVIGNGNHTEEELKEFIMFSLGIGNCSQKNPFVDESGEAEIIDVEFE